MTLQHDRMTNAIRIAYETAYGCYYQGLAEMVLSSSSALDYEGQVDLILTSPPFPLNRKKAYGNLQGKDYRDWLAGYAQMFRRFLKPAGSIVMELGNAWEPGKPVMSTLPIKSLLAFQEAGEFFLCQEFVCHNQARLPSPVQWVNKERIRVKDSYTRVWWMSPSERPEANNRRVLTPYSKAMKQLLHRQSYNAGPRPSEHVIGETSFLTNNGGAIPSNVLTISNTQPNQQYQKYCRSLGLKPHPARMQRQLASFFINFLTVEGDLVLDPFAGSNTTGAVAEDLKRRWVAIEPNGDYILGSHGHFSLTGRLPLAGD